MIKVVDNYLKSDAIAAGKISNHISLEQVCKINFDKRMEKNLNQEKFETQNRNYNIH